MNPVNRIMAVAKHPAAIIGIGLLAADQVSKTAVRAYMPIHSSHWLVNNTIGLHHNPNENLHLTKIFLLAASATLVGLTAIFLKAKTKVEKIAVSLIASGAGAHIIDRARFGEVTDFIVTKPWPFTYDIADIGITAGVALLAYHWLTTKDA